MSQARIWLRARFGGRFGVGHLARARTLADALKAAGAAPGLILDTGADLAAFPGVEGRFETVRIPPGAPLAAEAGRYPGPLAPVVLDLSHRTMLADLPALAGALKAQGRPVALIDGPGAEAYRADGRPEVDAVLTPYLLSAGESSRAARRWVEGPDYAVLGPEYARPPQAPIAARAQRAFVFISGTDPWFGTEAALSALAELEVLADWRIDWIAGPGFDDARIARIQNRLKEDPRFVMRRAPASLRALMVEARLAVLGPGLAKYEAAACALESVVICPDAEFARANAAFAEAGLCRLIRLDAPAFAADLDDSLTALAHGHARGDPRAIIDGQGAGRAAAALVAALGL